MNPEKQSIVEYKQVTKSFGSKCIYEDLTLQVNQGETITILGGSGTGKSVLIKMLVGLLDWDSGAILYRGQDLSQHSEEQFIEVRKKISMVFQLAALFDSLTVFENIAFPLREHLECTEAEIKEKVDDLLETIHLPPSFAERYPSELSGGMKKLVGLARSIALEPEIILYDEPTTGLDPESTVRVNKLIREIQEKRKVTSFVITHDMAGAFYFSDRIAFLHNRRIHKVGTVDEIKNSQDLQLFQFLRGIPS